MEAKRPMPPSDIFSRLRDLHRMAWAAPHELGDELSALNEDPNAKLDEDAVRPLHLAAISPMPGATEGVEALLAAGADPNLADGMGAPPLFWAARWGEAATVAELAVKTEEAAELKDSWDRTIAHWWAMGDDGTGKASEQVLAEVKADFAAIDHIGAGPVHWAAAVGGRIRRLLALDGEMATMPDRAGFLPFHYTTGAGITLKAVPHLIAAGADPAHLAGQFRPADFLDEPFEEEWNRLTGAPDIDPPAAGEPS